MEKQAVDGEQRQRRGTDAVSHAMMMALVGLAAAGCGGREARPPLIPVAGKVTLDGRPAAEGSVSFRDMATGLIQPSGVIAPDGTYKLRYEDREGAPAGTYRVLVSVRETPMTPSGEMADLPKVIVNRKFLDAKRTPLNVEVKDGMLPGTYDFAVTR